MLQCNITVIANVWVTNKVPPQTLLGHCAEKEPGPNGTTLSPNALHFSLPQRLQFGFENTTRLGQERQIL